MALFHLLSIVGGYWLFHGLQVNNTKTLAKKLDADNYAGSQAITIRLPLSLSNNAVNENYERVDGNFVYQGVAYRLIKQKFYKDSVYIVCYPDNTGEAIDNALTAYVGSFTDKGPDTKSTGKNAVVLIKDYISCVKIELSHFQISSDIKSISRYQNFYHSRISLSVDQPPEFIG